MNFFAKISVKHIIMVLLVIFYLYIILSNLLGNKEGLDTISKTSDTKDTKDTKDMSSKNNKQSTKLENQDIEEVLEEDVN
jgi:hypothetical protein